MWRLNCMSLPSSLIRYGFSMRMEKWITNIYSEITKKKPKKILSNASAFDLVRHTLKDTQNHKMCSLRRIWRNTTTKSFFFELLCPNFGCYLRVIEFDDWKTTDKHDLAKTYNFVLTLLSIYHKLYYHDQCPTAILHHSVKFQFILILLIWIPLLRMNNSIK